MAERTLQEIRRSVGRELGDMLVLTATAAGTTTSLVDNKNLYLPTNACKNRVLYFTGGTAGNIGEKRIVSANDQANTLLQWPIELGAATVVADEAELWNTRGMGWDPVQEVNPAINDVIREVAQYIWLEDTESIGTFDQDTPYFSLPSGTRGLYVVEYMDSNSDTRWHEIPQADNQNAPGWHLERGANIVWIVGYWAQMADTNTVRNSPVYR